MIRKAVDEISHENLTIIDKDEIVRPRDLFLLTEVMKKYDVNIIDNLSFVVPRGENEVPAQAIVSEFFLNFVKTNNKTVVAIHHFSKGKRGDNNLRGSQKLKDDLTTYVQLERTDNFDSDRSVKFKLVDSRYDRDIGNVELSFSNGIFWKKY
jgi:hypothetical protein